MSQIKVSVIIPVYNVEKYISKCLDSILSQTLKEYEIIIVNDGSKDNSQTIIDKYVSKSKNIISLTKENGGQGSARNYGLKYATGEFVTYIDSDDWVEPTMFEEMYDLAIREKSDIVICDYTFVYDNNSLNRYMSTLYEYNSNILNNYVLSSATPTFKLIKRNLLEKSNFEFPNIRAYEDIAVVGSLALYTNKMSYLKKSFYNYYIRTGSTMNLEKYNPKMDDIFLSFEIISNKFKDKFKDEIEFIYISHLLHDASLRFLKYKECKNSLTKVNKIIKKIYPKWYKNKYFKRKDFKYKVMCFLIYFKLYKIIKIVSR